MGFSIPHLTVVLVIVVLIFGTKRLKNLGSDVGSAIKGFKQAVQDDEQTAAAQHNKISN
jgi:sec-independent protein translocase protein TatA